MVGAISMVGSSVIDSHTGPCLCLDSLPSANIISQSTSTIKKHIVKKPGSNLELSSSFIDSWQGWKVSTMAVSRRKQSRKNKKFEIVSELGGQYEDNFEDVKNALVNYFTYKAVRTVMHQLYELNPSHYGWFYEFVRTNKPGGDGKRFIRALQKERHDLAERVMITRLHLYGKWIKKCNHAEIYNSISDDNLGLMRERLMETVIWPADDSSSEMIS